MIGAVMSSCHIHMAESGLCQNRVHVFMSSLKVANDAAARGLQVDRGGGFCFSLRLHTPRGPD